MNLSHLSLKQSHHPWPVSIQFPSKTSIRRCGNGVPMKRKIQSRSSIFSKLFPPGTHGKKPVKTQWAFALPLIILSSIGSSKEKHARALIFQARRIQKLIFHIHGHLFKHLNSSGLNSWAQTTTHIYSSSTPGNSTFHWPIKHWFAANKQSRPFRKCETIIIKSLTSVWLIHQCRSVDGFHKAYIYLPGKQQN